MCVYSAEAELHWSTVSASTTSEAYALLCVTVKLMGDKLLRCFYTGAKHSTVKRLNYQWWWFYIRWLERQVSDLRSGFTVSQWTGGRSLSHRSLFARILAAFPCIIWRLTLAQQNCLLFANHWAQWLRWRRTARKPDNSLVQPAESAWIFFFYITLCSFLVNWKTIGLSVCPLATTHNHLITRWLHWSFNRRQSSVFSHSLPVRNILVIKYLLSNL